MKKLINDPADVVADALRGIADRARRPGAGGSRASDRRTAATRPGPGKVGLVSGGGSGHEPMHGGFVGLGMLDAACAGEVFTSPVPDQVVEATQHGRRRGRRAAHREELHRRRDELRDGRGDGGLDAGTEVRAVVTNDDVAVTDSLYTAGRRGVGVTVLLEKIVGAAAEQGRSLAEVADLASRVNDCGRSMGMALTSCTVPAAGKPTFALGEDEMEIGIGIHGEPGRSRVPLAPARDVAALLVDPVLGDLPYASGDAVIAFVNGLGGTPLLELYVMYAEVAAILERAGHHGGPVAGRQLHDLAGHGRLLGHPAPGRRRTRSACGTRRSTRPACAGACDDGRSSARTTIWRRWIRACAERIHAEAARLDRARRGDRGRRPRQQPGPRLRGGGGQDRRRGVRRPRRRCSRPSA